MEKDLIPTIEIDEKLLRDVCDKLYYSNHLVKQQKQTIEKMSLRLKMFDDMMALFNNNSRSLGADLQAHPASNIENIADTLNKILNENLEKRKEEAFKKSNDGGEHNKV